MTSSLAGGPGDGRALLQTPTDLGLDAGLASAGFNVAGVLGAARYDALVPPAWSSAELLPGARSVVVLGCGGRAFGEAFLSSPEAAGGEHPVDRFSARMVSSSAAAMVEGAARAVFYWEQRGGKFADFVALGRAAGLGAPGRLGLLLHPVYGPWLSLRAAIVTSAELPPTRASSDFASCVGCSAPCAEACPGDAVGLEGFDAAACAEITRSNPACTSRCAARHACVLAREHAFAPEVERRFRTAAIAYTSTQK